MRTETSTSTPGRPARALRPVPLAAAALATALAAGSAASAGRPLFHTSDNCLACHNGLTAPSGEDVSIGFDWRASMMANAARDPYWQAGVRRETIDHPAATAAIEHECSTCHMPMAHYQAYAAGQKGQVFAHLPAAAAQSPESLLAVDGVGCALCHQIGPGRLGTRESFVGGFVIDTARPLGQREVYGRFAIDDGLALVMRSASEFSPIRAEHVERAELCATCHTLLTHALGPDGEVIGTLPEQVPYLEWQHSDYRDAQSCQDCHMPQEVGPTAIASVLAAPRDAFALHRFRGGNFFMPRLLNRNAVALGVQALPQELDATAHASAAHLQESAASVTIEEAVVRDGRLESTVAVSNLAGHKLPTAYPSRRAWLHVTVRDASGQLLFESGRVTPRGSIRGNDNDDDAGRYEPHHAVIESEDQVQIYEAIMADRDGAVTTGLLRGLRYLKDNRLLPVGFDKASAGEEVAVHGAAAGDADFTEGGDRVRYRVAVEGATAPLRIEAELWYQPIGFRWADNLRAYSAPEPLRFVSYWEPMAEGSALQLARAEATCARPMLAPVRGLPSSSPSSPALTE